MLSKIMVEESKMQQFAVEFVTKRLARLRDMKPRFEDVVDKNAMLDYVKAALK